MVESLVRFPIWRSQAHETVGQVQPMHGAQAARDNFLRAIEPPRCSAVSTMRTSGRREAADHERSQHTVRTTADRNDQ